MERLGGIEPPFSGWRPGALPLSYSRMFVGRLDLPTLSGGNVNETRSVQKGWSALLCHPIYGTIALYNRIMALGRHLFFKAQIFCNEISKLLMHSLSMSIAIPNLHPCSGQRMRPLPVHEINDRKPRLAV